MRCPVPSNVTLLSAQSHYHARGDNYGAYLDTGMTSLATTPFYTSDSWTSPPLQTMNMAISSGSFIRFECDYDNTNPTPNGPDTVAYYQGQSAFTNEMCLFIGTYYPDIGAQTDNCEKSPDMFGTGTVSCTDTLTCLAACPSSKGSALNTSPCVQGCLVNSCPASFDTLNPLLNCIESKCSSQCASGGSGCMTCVQDSCAGEYIACSTSACTY